MNLRTISAASLGEQLAVYRRGGLGGVVPSRLAFQSGERGSLMWTSTLDLTPAGLRSLPPLLLLGLTRQVREAFADHEVRDAYRPVLAAGRGGRI